MDAGTDTENSDGHGLLRKWEVLRSTPFSVGTARQRAQVGFGQFSCGTGEVLATQQLVCPAPNEFQLGRVLTLLCARHVLFRAPTDVAPLRRRLQRALRLDERLYLWRENLTLGFAVHVYRIYAFYL